MSLILDLSGYSFSGKSALYQLISSCNKVKSFGIESEFDLIRAQGGVYDLYQNTTGVNWSLIRSSDAVHRFIRLYTNLSGKRNRISRFYKLGTYYDDLIPRFSQKSLDYLRKLTISSYHAYWPFPWYTSYPRSMHHTINKLLSPKQQIFLCRHSSDSFLHLTRAYFRSLFTESFAPSHSIILLNNAFETSNPTSSIQFFECAKSIIVDRDPRAIYASAFIDSMRNKSSPGNAVIGSSVSDFVNRYLLQRRTKDSAIHSVLNLKFEDLMLSFDTVKSQLLDFLNQPSSFFAGSCFRPSSTNIYPWRSSSYPYLATAAEEISSSIPEFCYL